MLIITSQTHIIILIDAEKCLLKINISYDKIKHLTSEAGKRQIQHFKDIDLLLFFFNNKKCIGSGNWEAQEVI